MPTTSDESSDGSVPERPAPRKRTPTYLVRKVRSLALTPSFNCHN